MIKHTNLIHKLIYEVFATPGIHKVYFNIKITHTMI